MIKRFTIESLSTPIEFGNADDDINIALYFNYNYLKYAAVTIESIAKNSTKSLRYNIFLIVDFELQEKEESLLLKMLKDVDNVKLLSINVNHVLYVFDGIKSNGYHLTTFYRLFVLTPVFSGVQRIITMDCDAVVVEDVARLYHIDLQGHTLGAVREYDARWKVRCKYPVNVHYGVYSSKEYFYKYIGVKDVNNYFCAGVILWDLKKPQLFDIFSNMLVKLKEKPYIFPDQDVLNLFFEFDSIDLGKMWNQVNYILEGYEEYLSEEEKAKYIYMGRPGIIHYAGKKPWGCDHTMYDNEYWAYAALSPWYSEILEARQENIKINKIKIKKKKMENLFFPEGSIRKKTCRILLASIYKAIHIIRGYK